MNKYELMFVVNVADEEKIKAAVQLVQDVIKKIGGTVDRLMNGVSALWLMKLRSSAKATT